MIKEFKVDSKKDKSLDKHFVRSLDKHFVRSLVRADARKKHIKNKNNKNNKQGKPGGKYSKKTKKNIQNGGNITKQKDKFEVTTLNNVDPSKYSLSQYVNANIDWGMLPGAPPVDCSIM